MKYTKEELSHIWLDSFLGLEYKHKFAKVIDEELKKNEQFKNYYNNWGSRVYLVSHELGFFRPYDKIDENIEIEGLNIDYKQLKVMHCDYIFSKFKIKNAEKNIKLEKIFTDDNDKIYLYSLI